VCVQAVLITLLEVSHFPLHLTSLQAATDIQEKEQKNLRGQILVEGEEKAEGNIQVI